MTQLLKNAYPEYDWNVFKFGKVPEEYWDNADHQKVRRNFFNVNLSRKIFLHQKHFFFM